VKIEDTAEGAPAPTNSKNTQPRKRPSKLDLTPSEIKDMVKIKRLEKSGGTKPPLEIKEEKLKQALDDGTVDFTTRDRKVLNEILKP
jgi:hypothetical protein